jgi:hypothetical protein
MADEATMQTEDTGTTVEGAAEALGKAREAASQEDRTRQPEPADTAPAATDDAPQESPPDQQEAAADAEQQTEPDAEQPTIGAPSWFNAEERELFAALPPEQQQAVQRLAHSTKAAESRRQNEHQAALRQAEEAAQIAAQERQHFQSQLQHYKHPIVSAFQHEFADVLQGKTDHFRLAQDTERWGRYQAFQSEFQRIAQVEQQLSQHQQQERTALMQKHVESRNAQLIEARPELKDPDKFQKYDSEVTEYLRGYGVPDERIAQVNFKELSIVEKAMKWDAAQKAKAQAPKMPQAGPGQKVIPSHVRALPKVIKPGVPNGGGAHDEKIAAIDQRARNTGSVDDAAARLRLRRERLSA